MFNLVYSEILKLKKSSTVLYLVLGSIAFSIFFILLMFITKNKPSWKNYANNQEDVMFMAVGIIIFTLLSSYIFLREYSDNTIRILYSYPVSKISIFISKILAIYIIITLVYILHFIVVFTGGILILKEPLSTKFFLVHLDSYIFSVILQFSIIPILVFFINISKNSVVSALLGVSALGINFYAYLTHRYEYCPFMLPYMPFMKLYKPICITTTIELALGVFGFGVILCVFQTLKVEKI
ncbi:ABC transporter permease [Clostridium estertheticum]|uniref:ABC transporter permease n=1 Tax=Clostridium estertheticum TaxID=238834 RepID=UPI001CF502F9|nr:ABC transporter permease [Clostridium estertheticum]MCB2342516.1 ABC transporter permease [Clostridium estertheticum]MCB2357082.1 ABC transporter permease [Clostridium estertheticum]WAG43791.1 ABC transporter permease [Clostridium estertheticum]